MFLSKFVMIVIDSVLFYNSFAFCNAGLLTRELCSFSGSISVVECGFLSSTFRFSYVFCLCAIVFLLFALFAYCACAFCGFDVSHFVRVDCVCLMSYSFAACRVDM